MVPVNVGMILDFDSLNLCLGRLGWLGWAASRLPSPTFVPLMLNTTLGWCYTQEAPWEMVHVVEVATGSLPISYNGGRRPAFLAMVIWLIVHSLYISFYFFLLCFCSKIIFSDFRSKVEFLLLLKWKKKVSVRCYIYLIDFNIIILVHCIYVLTTKFTIKMLILVLT